MKKIFKYNHYTLSNVITIIGMLILLIYTIIDVNILTSIFVFSIISGIILSYIYPIVQTITKLKLPLSLNIVITLHIIFSNWFGSAFNLYTLIPFYDLLLHGFFGFEAVLILFLLIIKLNSTNISLPFFTIMLLVFPIGCGALWELVEFLTDIITGGDCMHVWDALEAGINPISDTITDMFITLVVSLITTILFYIDRYFNYKVTKKIYYNFSTKEEKNKH